MYNIYFALFLFGMLVTNSIRIFRRAINEEQPATAQEYAMLLALAIGSMIALQLGCKAVYGVGLDFY